MALPTPGGVNQGAPASSLELDLPRERGVAGKAELQEDHAREVHPGRQDGFLEMWKEMKMWEDWCLRQKRKNRQGKDPRTFEENR